MIRVILPGQLRLLARVNGEVTLDLAGKITLSTLLNALESAYPMLRGTIRDPVTHKRRPFIRFFACKSDLSHETDDLLLPPDVASGEEPFLIVGAMAGG
jgi:hypothetical protein